MTHDSKHAMYNPWVPLMYGSLPMFLFPFVSISVSEYLCVSVF
jgi:hypothetical protein